MYFQIDFSMCQHFYLDNVGDQISSSFAYLVWLYFFHTSKGFFFCVSVSALQWFSQDHVGDQKGRGDGAGGARHGRGKHSNGSSIRQTQKLPKPLLKVKEMSRVKMFGRPGNGAPTGDVRKKKFTEHQLDLGMRRSQSMFTLDSMDGGLEGGGIAAPRWSDDQEIGVSGSTVTRLAWQPWGRETELPSPPLQLTASPGTSTSSTPPSPRCTATLHPHHCTHSKGTTQNHGLHQMML